jgi:hypothetical protein
MPFREYSSYFASDELDAFMAAYKAAWEHLCATGTNPDQAAVLRRTLPRSFWLQPAKVKGKSKS